MEHYYISQHGIYFTQSCYHDDIEAVYVVNFDTGKEDMQKQLNNFLRRVRKEGADEQMAQLRKEFKTLRELL